MSGRAVALAFLGRFTDELLSGSYAVLAPTFRRVFGLSLVAVTLLNQVLFWVALVVEPPASMLIDLRSRRVLLTTGALFAGLALVVMGMAPGYEVLLVGFALYGIGSGPLAHTADVVLVESFPGDAERVFGRATFLDGVGALAAPLVVAAVSWAGLSWRVALVAVGVWGLLYGRALAGTRFPAPERSPDAERSSLIGELRANLTEVLRSREARRWLLFLFWLDLLEAPDVLAYVWLHEDVGMSQGAVAAYAAGEQVVGLVALLWLDRWLGRRDSRPVLAAVTLGLLVLYPMWLFAPGVWGRVVVGVPLAFLWSLLWPIGRARSLTSVPGKAGAVTAVTTVFALAPMPLLFGVLAEGVGLRPAMLGVAVSALLLLLVTAAGSPGRRSRR
ncbi:MAG: MFS transporter [Actinomycetota bacterium]